MNGLFFCTYLHAFDDCYSYNKDERGMGRREALVTDLLSSCAAPNQRDALRYGIDTNSSTITHYFSGKRIPPDSIREEGFMGSDEADTVLENVRINFRDDIIHKIPENFRPTVVGRIVNLIKKDRTMPVEKRDELLKLATNGATADFLAETLRYAVIQPKPTDKFKFYFPNPPINNLPNIRTSYFTGRDNEIETIKRNFDAGFDYQSLSGISGSGKTQLALEYALWEFDGYDYIWWIDCESEDTIYKSYTEIAEKLKNGNDGSAPDHLMRDVQSWCQANGFWLMIFDNVQYGKTSHPYDLKKYLPPDCKTGHVLYTTLNDIPYRDEKLMPVGLFDEETGCDFIEQRLGKGYDEKQAIELVNRLGGLPLALEEACAFLETMKHETVRGYIEMLDKYHIGFGDDLISNSTHEQTLLEMMNVSIGHINNENSKLILGMLSYFKDQGLDGQMIHMAQPLNGRDKCGISESFRDLLLEDLHLRKATKPLQEYSLCRPIYEGEDEPAKIHIGRLKQLYCHKLTQEIVREHFGGDEDAVRIGVELCSEAIRHCSALTGDYYPLIPDLIAFLTNASNRLDYIEDDVLLKKIAELYRYIAWALSEDNARQGWIWDRHITFAEKAYGHESPQTVHAYLEYFELFAEKNYAEAFKKLNDAFILLQDEDLDLGNRKFDTCLYEKRDGYPSLLLGSSENTLLSGYNEWKIICSVIAAVTLAVENKDSASAKKFSEAQRNWFKMLLTDFATDWNSQGDDELDDNTEDFDPEEILRQLDDLLGSM